MFSRSPAAANRMTRALCVCDTGIMRTAVRRYVDGLLDAELETLLHRSLNELDSYHRMLLELGLSAGTFSASGEPWELRKMFADFVSENPRALEQLSPAMIEGVLRQAAIADPSLAREFLMPSLKSNQWFAGGVAGALCAALISLAYLQFNASGNVPAVAVAPSFSTGAYEQRPSLPAVASAAIRHRRRLAHAATRPVARLPFRIPESAALHRVRSAPYTNRALRVARVRTSPVRTPVAHLVGIPKNPVRRVAALPSVAHLPSGVVEAQALSGSGGQQDTSYLVEQTSVQQSASEPSKTEAQPTTGVPTTYCYARGTWRPC